MPSASYFLSLSKESNQRTPFKGEGISISPERALRVRLTIFAKQKSVFRLNAKETPDGFLSHYLPFRWLSVCATPPLWKPHPGVSGDYQIAPLPQSGKGRWRPLAAVMKAFFFFGLFLKATKDVPRPGAGHFWPQPQK